jgi:hypothetical protein
VDLTAIVVSSIIGIAAIVVALIIANRQQRRTSVDFDVLSDIKLIDSDAADAFANRIEVTYDSRPLSHPRIIDVKVMNTGNTAVRAEDYERPIVIELEDCYRAIEAAVINESTENITGDIFEKLPNGARTISMRPPLLNPHDWFTLRILFDNKNSRLDCSHRIVGGQQMREYSPAIAAKHARLNWYGFVFIVIAILTTGIVGGIIAKSYLAALVLGAFAGVIGGLAMSAVSALYSSLFSR